MSKDLNQMREALETEKQWILEQINKTNQEITCLSGFHEEAAECFTQELLPNLNKKTVKSLAKIVPGFNFPVVRVWLLFQKIDPRASLEGLRTALKKHLENLPPGEVPEDWQINVSWFKKIIAKKQELLKAHREMLKSIERSLAKLNS